MGASTSSPESGWTAVYNEIKCRHDAAFLVIQTAISLEEQEKPEEVRKGKGHCFGNGINY